MNSMRESRRTVELSGGCRAGRWIAVFLVPFVPALFWTVYQPVNCAWTVEVFGCGCSPHLNANDINGILALVVLGVSVIALLRVSRVFGRWTRTAHFMAGLALQCAASYWGLAFSLWR